MGMGGNGNGNGNDLMGVGMGTRKLFPHTSILSSNYVSFIDKCFFFSHFKIHLLIKPKSNRIRVYLWSQHTTSSRNKKKN